LKNPQRQLTNVAADERVIVVGFLACRVLLERQY